MSFDSQLIGRTGHWKEVITAIDDQIKITPENGGHGFDHLRHRSNLIHQLGEMRVESIHFVLCQFCMKLFHRRHIKRINSLEPGSNGTPKSIQRFDEPRCFWGGPQLWNHKIVPSPAAHGLLRALWRRFRLHHLDRESNTSKTVSEFDQVGCEMLHRSLRYHKLLGSQASRRAYYREIGCKRCQPAPNAAEHCGHNCPCVPPKHAPVGPQRRTSADSIPPIHLMTVEYAGPHFATSPFSQEQPHG